jgi:transglutaminase-like putative cysteine protease
MPPPAEESPLCGMMLSVRHLTRFRYDGVVLDSYNDARLCPVSDPLQRCAAFDLRIEPKASVHTFHDFYLNRVDHFELHEAHEMLEIESLALVETRPDARGLTPAGLTLDALNDRSVTENYFDFITESRFANQTVDLWREAVDVIGATVGDLWEDAVKLGRHVYQAFDYDPDSTHVHTSAAEAWKDRKGVCQDYAHVMIALCRGLGIPARYVSGYFYNGKTGDENEASHAWVEIFLPHFGWKGFDPTHNRDVDARYIKLAIGRDYGDIKPVSGSYRGKGTQRMDVVVQIRKVC